jgi:hypothetical protein
MEGGERNAASLTQVIKEEVWGIRYQDDLVQEAVNGDPDKVEWKLLGSNNG